MSGKISTLEFEEIDREITAEIATLKEQKKCNCRKESRRLRSKASYS